MIFPLITLLQEVGFKKTVFSTKAIHQGLFVAKRFSCMYAASYPESCSWGSWVTTSDTSWAEEILLLCVKNGYLKKYSYITVSFDFLPSVNWFREIVFPMLLRERTLWLDITLFTVTSRVVAFYRSLFLTWYISGGGACLMYFRLSGKSSMDTSSTHVWVIF